MHSLELEFSYVSLPPHVAARADLELLGGSDWVARESIPSTPQIRRVGAETMKFLCLAAILATAAAFTAGPSAFHNVGERTLNNVFTESGSAHRTRRATIVMDGKANGE